MNNITIPLNKLLEVQEIAVSLYEEYCEREQVAWDEWRLNNPQPHISDTSRYTVWKGKYLRAVINGGTLRTSEEELGILLKDFFKRELRVCVD